MKRTIYTVAVEYDKTAGKHKSFVTCDYSSHEHALDTAMEMIYGENLDEEQEQERIEELKSRGSTTLSDRCIVILCSDDFPPEGGDDESDRSFVCIHDKITDKVLFDLV